MGLTRPIWLSGFALLLASVLVVAIHGVDGGAPDAGARAQLAWEVQARRALQEGSLPLWNPYQFGGQPHLADPRTLAFYPPHLLLRAVPAPFFFPVSVILHVWLAALGAWAIARQVGATPVTALLGALGLLAVLVPTAADAHSSTVYAVSWLPIIVACAMRSSVRPGSLPHVGLVTSLSMAFLTGSTRGALYAIGAVVAGYGYAWIQAAPAGRMHRDCLGRLTSACVLAAGLTAFQSVPAAHLRIAAADALAYDDPWMQPERLANVGAVPIGSRLEVALRPLRGHRTATACERVVDSSQLAALGIPVAGGQGGIYTADYSRVMNLTRAGAAGMDATYRGMSGIGEQAVRPALLDLLAVEYLVSCGPVDAGNWSLVTQVDEVGIYRNVQPVSRAFWSCPARLVGRAEAGDALSGLGRTVIHVRWTQAVTDERRIAAEKELRLTPLRVLGERTWQYELADVSRQQLGAIVVSPDVEDTHGFDRSTLIVAGTSEGVPEAATEWLLPDSCDETGSATLLESDRADGGVVMAVEAPRDGVVFLSEPYYPVRSARVDGQPVTPVKVNLAFTGIPVPAGTHRVELTYDQRWVRTGATLSLVTLCAWMYLARRGRRPATRDSDR